MFVRRKGIFNRRRERDPNFLGSDAGSFITPEDTWGGGNYQNVQMVDQTYDNRHFSVNSDPFSAAGVGRNIPRVPVPQGPWQDHGMHARSRSGGLASLASYGMPRNRRGTDESQEYQDPRRKMTMSQYSVGSVYSQKSHRPSGVWPQQI